MDIRRFSRQHLVHGLILAIYVAAVSFALIHHEPWRDEADSWLASRDVPLSGLLNFTRHAGTPALWYVTLMPFAKMGFPYATQAWINAGFAFMAAALLLCRGSFKLPIKVLFLFNYFLAFEYAVIARSYMLSAFLLFIIASLYPARIQRPLMYGLALALLANTNVHSLFLVLVISFEFVISLGGRNARAAAAGLMVAAAGIALALLQVWPAADPQVIARGEVFSTLDQVFANIFVPTRRIASEYLAIAGQVLSEASLVATAILLRRQPRLCLAFISSVLGLCFLYALIYYGGMRHAGLIQLCAIFYLWIAGSENPPPVDWLRVASWTIIAAALLLSCSVTIRVYAQEYRFAFSASREMADFIVARGLTNQTIAAFPDSPAEAVLPYLPQRTFWYAGGQRSGSYMKWDRTQSLNRNISVVEALHRIERGTTSSSNILVLQNVPLPPDWPARYVLLYTTTSTVFTAVDEEYWLYQKAGQLKR